MDLSLKNKVAIITGGSTGVGASAALMLAEEGCNVVINYYIDEEMAKEFTNEIVKKTNTKCIAVYGDISNFSDVESIFNRAIEEFEKIDIVVNSAALLTKALVKKMTEMEWKKSVDVNLNGAFFVNKLAVDYFLKREQSGKIINLVSQSAFNGSSTGHAHYAASKAGVVGLTRSLAKEVSRENILVNAISPGIIETPLAKEKVQQNMEYYLKSIPIGRIAKPEEVASVVIFLASKLGNYITGATIDVSGGISMR